MIRFKLDSKLRYKVIVWTTDDKRLTSIEPIVHNQCLYFTTDIDPETVVVTSETLVQVTPDTKLQSPSDKSGVFTLWAGKMGCSNGFLEQCYQLKEKYRERVIIGECYPFRVTVLIAERQEKTGSVVWVTFTEGVAGSVTYKVIGKEEALNTKIVNTCRSVISTGDIVGAVDDCFAEFRTLCSSTIKRPYMYKPYMDEDVINLFPRDFEVLTTITFSDFTLNMLEFEQSVSEIMDVPQSIAKHHLLEHQMRVSVACKLIGTEHADNLSAGMGDMREYKFLERSDIECSICYCPADVEAMDTVQLTCGHIHCRDCVTQYIVSEVQSGRGNLAAIKCLCTGCPTIFDTCTILSLLDPSLSVQFTTQYFNDVVRISRSRLCQTSDCKSIVYIPPHMTDKIIPYVPCSCNTDLCISCGDRAIHWPLPCPEAVVVPDYVPKEMESIEYIMLNSTICPNCKFPIEKSSGCNHMSCTQCRHNFCYGCGGLQSHTATNGLCPGEKAKLLSTASAIVEANGIHISHFQLIKMIMGRNHVPTTYERVTMLLEAIAASNLNIRSFAQQAKNDMIEMNKPIRKLPRDLRRLVRDRLRVLFAEIYGMMKPKRRIEREHHTGGRPATSKTLICRLSLNGYTDILGTAIVNRNASDFRQEVANVLNKRVTTPVIPHLIKLYSSKGGLIRCHDNILYDENLFVAINGEDWQTPVAGSPPVTRPASPPKKTTKRNTKTLPPPTTKKSALEELNDLRNNPIYRQDDSADEDVLPAFAYIVGVDDPSDYYYESEYYDYSDDSSDDYNDSGEIGRHDRAMFHIEKKRPIAKAQPLGNKEFASLGL
eukprot:gene11606-13549_t